MEAETEKTMPRAGLVSQIRQNWSVFEDQALAQQIQQQEISQHLLGNRHRNQILREDIPQAKKEQSLEEIQASLEYNQYRQKLDEVAQRDAELAQQLTKKQEFRPGNDDAKYIAQRDEAFAKNLQRIEREYREKQTRHPRPPPIHSRQHSDLPTTSDHGSSHSRQHSEPHRGATSQYVSSNPHHSDLHDPRSRTDLSYHDLGGGLQYNDDQYQVQVARPAMITDEPVYVNNIQNDSFDDHQPSPLMPPTPFRGGGEPSKYLDMTGHNVSSEFSGGRSSQSSSSRSRSSMASTSPSELMGACGGAAAAVVSPGDVLGLGSALSPAELRAAEAAERLLEQEKKDMEIARQLQVESSFF